MSKQIGLDMYLYRNTGSYGSPAWNLIPNVRDLTGPDSYGEADVSRRNTGAAAFKQVEPTLREFSAEWDMVYDPSDTDFTTLQTNYAARTLTEFAFADGAIGTDGTVSGGGTSGVKFFRIECKVTEMSRNEALEDANIWHVVVKPCYSANAPGVTTVS